MTSPDFGLDGRTRKAKAAAAKFDLLVSELGGQECCGPQHLSLIRRAVMLELQIERHEAQLAQDGEIDIAGKLTQQVNALLGLYKALGLDRTPAGFERRARRLAAG